MENKQSGSFWEEIFSQCQSLKLPTDFARLYGEKRYTIDNPPSYVSSKLVQLPSDVSNQEDVESFMISLFGTLLSRYTSEESFLIGTNLNSFDQSQSVDKEFVVPYNTNSSELKENTFSYVCNKVSQNKKVALEQLQNVQSMENEVLKKIYPQTKSGKSSRDQYEQYIQCSLQIVSNNDEPYPVDTILEILPYKLSIVELHLKYWRNKNAFQLVYQDHIFSKNRIEIVCDQLVLLSEQILKNVGESIYDYSLVTSESYKVLPDPLSPISTTWEGSIYRLFEKNVEEYADKSAVIDNKENVSFKKLNQMSNRLARELIEKGVQKQDIVAIFGHRSISIVWTILAVLKIGAAFTILDPKYPSDRLIACLQVAGPKAAVTIKAAVKLPAKVREFMKSSDPENTVKAVHRVPTIEEALSDKDFMSRSCENLDIDVTANDLAVLTFTSGSTGLPKGVLGRHGPLTHFYPWMKEKFQFTDKEKFSMQSGISHDPLQRDIFTPWYLGATIYVPDDEEIVNPGQLAQWFKQKEITITHLTPAMGQLLTTRTGHENETAEDRLLPNLKYAFFVGDVLTRKFVKTLCDISPTCTVINLYGSTESQRSVTYYVVPRPGSKFSAEQKDNTGTPFSKLKDILPVGKGMKDVQALVLSRFTNKNQYQLAGIGEVGEIYIRSAHLSKGYKGKEEETNEKFIFNPFRLQNNEKVPENEEDFLNDRFYRTGDLGRFLISGDAICVGRADDQIKIRGFRIELGEINTALNSHPYVKECVTIVRTDMIENSNEKKIVSYYVLEKSNKELQRLMSQYKKTDSDLKEFNDEDDEDGFIAHVIRELRKHVRSKVPEYMLPSAFVLLDKLPLTPNGKIKKAGLPKPQDVNVIDEDFVAPRNALESQICEIWSDVLGIQRIGIHDNFFNLGGHSISATNLIFKIRQQIEGASTLPVNLLYKSPTIASVSIALENLRSGKSYDQTDVFDLYAETHLDRSIMVEKERPAELEDGDFDFSDKWVNPDFILLTGCTGFLGAFILSDLLKHTKARIYCLVRSKNEKDAFLRVKKALYNHQLVWNINPKSMSNQAYQGVDLVQFDGMLQDRIIPVSGDLSKPYLGLDVSKFQLLADSVDLILHNGALVHWMYPYEKLKPANVNGTIEILKLASQGKKIAPVHYVSSTSVFDSNRYGELSDVYESTNLPFHEDLQGGYAQSKYVAEKLIINARERGIPTCIYRPGYVTGHSKSGVWNPDDYLCRMIKGCIQLGCCPDLPLTKMDLSPVDFVSRAITYLCLQPDSILKHKAYHLVNPHEFYFNALFDTGRRIGYTIDKIDVDVWKKMLFEYVDTKEQLMKKKKASGEETSNELDQNALYPMLTYFSDDFGQRMRTKRPWYDNSNTLDGLFDSGIVCPPVITLLGTYYRFLVQCDFLDLPENPTQLALKQFKFKQIYQQRFEPPKKGAFLTSDGRTSPSNSKSQSSDVESISSISSISSYKDLMRTGH